MRVVALIPVRRGSKRIPGKNLRYLGQHPLLAYTLNIAHHCPLFRYPGSAAGNIVVVAESVDSDEKWIMNHYAPGSTLISRPPETATDAAPDYLWVRHAFATVYGAEPARTGLASDRPRVSPDAFMILRPTSPFRTVNMLLRAWEQFHRCEAHSLRAVEPVKQHPGKMWWCNGPGYPLTPVCDAKRSDGTPWHSCPTQTLPSCYVQNASLEIAWSYVLDGYGTISGRKIAPFFTDGYEGYDINTPEDWTQAERVLTEATVNQPYMKPMWDWRQRKATWDAAYVD